MRDNQIKTTTENNEYVSARDSMLDKLLIEVLQLFLTHKTYFGETEDVRNLCKCLIEKLSD